VPTNLQGFGIRLPSDGYKALSMSNEAHHKGVITRDVVDGVPVLYVRPVGNTEASKLALWLPSFAQTKESTLPYLRELAKLGFVAVSLDPWQHGERGFESPQRLISRVFEPGRFRRYMWPIIGQTTLDAKRVVDWALHHLVKTDAVVAGGLSMGGDIAVALAGIDTRIARVAAIIATPDWTRPGMRYFTAPYDVVQQGEADDYATWFYETMDPLTHIDAYQRECAITFECGETDTHVPPDGATRFRDELVAKDASARKRIRVNLHKGLGHGDGADPVFFANCKEWLSQARST
jgi:uncharacterized protein